MIKKVFKTINNWLEVKDYDEPVSVDAIFVKENIQIARSILFVVISIISMLGIFYLICELITI